MKELLLYIARNLVDDPDAVSVTEVEGAQELTLELRGRLNHFPAGPVPAGLGRRGQAPSFLCFRHGAASRSSTAGRERGCSGVC